MNTNKVFNFLARRYRPFSDGLLRGQTKHLVSWMAAVLAAIRRDEAHAVEDLNGDLVGFGMARLVSWGSFRPDDPSDIDAYGDTVCLDLVVCDTAEARRELLLELQARYPLAPYVAWIREGDPRTLKRFSTQRLINLN